MNPYENIDCFLNEYYGERPKEQFLCLCQRTIEDDCDKKEPCKECETCFHFRKTTSSSKV